MLRDVIEFIQSRTDLKTREAVLREINYAWQEIWSTSDLPDSVFEISVKPIDSTPRISLPFYVDTIRGVKRNCSKERIELVTPRRHYQDYQYRQSTLQHKILGSSPLITSITNAIPLTLTFTAAEAQNVVVTLIGPTDQAAKTREQVTFEPGETEKVTSSRFTDLLSLTKDVLTISDLSVSDSTDAIIASISNGRYEARNKLVQINDCECVSCSDCECFDVLYKRVADILYYDEDSVPYQDVLMAKVMEWWLLPKEDGEKKAILYGQKASQLLNSKNNAEDDTVKMLDFSPGRFNTRYHGSL